MNENEDFVIAGPGASATLERLYPGHRKDKVDDMQILLYLRDNQDKIHPLDTVEGDGLERAIALYFTSEEDARVAATA